MYDDPDVDPPLRSLWTVVGWFVGAGVCLAVAGALLRRLERGR